MTDRYRFLEYISRFGVYTPTGKETIADFLPVFDTTTS